MMERWCDREIMEDRVKIWIESTIERRYDKEKIR
jgi:hypothetical protein